MRRSKYLTWGPRVFAMADAGGAGGGASGGGGAGAGNANPPGGAAEPNAELVAAVTKSVTESVLKAVTEQVLPRAIAGAINRSKEEATKLLDERLKTLTGQTSVSDPNSGPQPSAEVVALKQQLKESNERMGKLEKENLGRAEREEKTRVEMAIHAALDNGGVVNPSYKRALTAQFRSDPGLKVTPEGVFVTVRQNGMEDFVTIESHVLSYIRSEEGKSYLPPVNAIGVPAMRAGANGSGMLDFRSLTPEALAADPKLAREVGSAVVEALGLKR